MKKIIKHSILLSILLVLFNCQKEDDTITQDIKQNNSNFKFTTIPFKIIENDKSLTTILEKQSAKQIEAKTSKSIYNEQYNFTVNTNYAKLIENNGLKRYTFGVTRTEDNGLLENLLLKEQTDETYKVYLIQYDITTQERNTLANKEIVDVENKITYLPLEDISSSIFNKVNSNAETCTVYSYEWQDGNLCSANGNHSYQDGGYSESNPGGCHAWGNPDLMATSGGYVLTSNEQDCGSGDSTGYEPNNDTTNSDTTNGTTNSNGSGNYTPIPDTEIILCTDCPLVEDECSSTEALNSLTSSLGLDSALATCLSDEEKCLAVGALNTFLNHNDTPEDIEFAQIASQAICDGDIIDYPNRVIFDSTFTNNQKIKCVYDKLKGLSNTIFNSIINNHFDSARNTNLKFKIDNISTGEDAQTRPFYSQGNTISQYLIVFDTSFVTNASSIELALTIIHEIIHAELIERCRMLGLIQNASFVSALGQTNITFTTSPTVFSVEGIIFNQLLLHYNALPPTSSNNWNHDFFNALNYRLRMAQNLVSIHTLLNDANNDFLTNVNNDPSVVGGPYSIQQLMEYIAWIGLEDTQEYLANISAVPTELAKKVYIEGVANTKFTHNCIP